LAESPKSARPRKTKTTSIGQVKLNKLRTSMPIVNASLNRLNSPRTTSNLSVNKPLATTAEFTSLTGLAGEKNVGLQLNNKLTKQVFSLPKMKNI